MRIVDQGSNVQAGNVLREFTAAYEYSIGIEKFSDKFANPALLAKNSHRQAKIRFTSKKGQRVLSDNELAYVTKRFDLTSTPGINFFIEDGASICDVHSLNKGSDALSYETCIKTMVKACGGATATAIAAQAVKLVLFSSIVGNNDLH
jgi:hypothetical protein